MTKLRIDKIRRDGGTQPRAQLDGVTVSEYADAMERGNTFPPVKVMHDGENYWLYDGFHRVQAAEQIGREEVEAEVEQGTKQEAQWASLAANKRHGLRRSQEDKRRAIKRALKGWGEKKSNNQIAQHIGCSDRTVGKYRRELESTSQITKSTEREGADGRTIDTSNIGGQSSEGASQDRTQKSLPTKPGGDGSPSKPSRSEPPTSSTSSAPSTTKPTRTKPSRSTGTDGSDPDLTPPEPEPDDPLTREDIVKQVCQHIAQIDISTGAIDAVRFMKELGEFTDEQRERVAAQLRSTADRLATRADKIDPS